MMQLLGGYISKIAQVLNHLQSGKFVLVYDHDEREAETDLVIASQFVTPASICQMRNDGGGLIFIMTSYQIAEKLSLPFLTDVYEKAYKQYPILKALIPNDLLYDTKSSFSLYINHRDSFTGITDKDRSLTMQRFSSFINDITTQKLPNDQIIQRFGKEFRSPGHVPICIAAKNLLDKRQGHTELIISLLLMAGLQPAGSGCEMMADTGDALSKINAQKYAKTHGLLFITGDEVIDAWQRISR